MSDNCQSRFSFDDLLLGIVLVVVGVNLAIVLISLDWRMLQGLPIGLSLLCLFVAFGASGAVIGAGLFAPFRLKALGAGAGFVLGGLFIVLASLMGI